MKKLLSAVVAGAFAAMMFVIPVSTPAQAQPGSSMAQEQAPAPAKAKKTKKAKKSKKAKKAKKSKKKAIAQ